MRVDLLSLLPILGGYIFLTRAYVSRYEAMHDSGYHLFFKSAIVGAALAALSYFLLSPFFAAEQLLSIFDVGTPTRLDVLAMILTVPMGYYLASIFNTKNSKETASQRTAEKLGDRFELCISRAFTEQRPIEISTENGKSYIGIPPRTLLSHRKDPDVELLVLASGYRDSETRELIITTLYEQKNTAPVDADVMLIIVPMSRIVSIRFFDLDYYVDVIVPQLSPGSAPQVASSPDPPPVNRKGSEPAGAPRG